MPAHNDGKAYKVQERSKSGRGPFRTVQFTPTKWDSADAKAEFANRFVRFVERDFDPKIYTKKFYQRLCQMFGFIAHYDMSGFWNTYFCTAADKLRFIQGCLRSKGRVGDPAWTWCDVEGALVEWLEQQDVTSLWEQQVQEEVRSQELAILEKLEKKYRPVCAGHGNLSLIQQRFETPEQAEEWIATMQKIDPQGVHMGAYYIDAPEEGGTRE
jgi:hypothetical protein